MYTDSIYGYLWWEEEYPFLVPNLLNLGLDINQRFGEKTHRIPTFLLSITPDNKYTLLMEKEIVNIYLRFRYTLFYKTGYICRDSVLFGSLYNFFTRLPANDILTDLRDPVYVTIPIISSIQYLIPLQVGLRDGFWYLLRGNVQVRGLRAIYTKGYIRRRYYPSVATSRAISFIILKVLLAIKQISLKFNSILLRSVRVKERYLLSIPLSQSRVLRLLRQIKQNSRIINQYKYQINI